MQRATISVVHHMLVQDIVQLRDAPLVGIPLVGKSKLILHIFSYPLSKLSRQILKDRVVLPICILEPHTVRDT